MASKQRGKRVRVEMNPLSPFDRLLDVRGREFLTKDGPARLVDAGEVEALLRLKDAHGVPTVRRVKHDDDTKREK